MKRRICCCTSDNNPYSVGGFVVFGGLLTPFFDLELLPLHTALTLRFVSIYDNCSLKGFLVNMNWD